MLADNLGEAALRDSLLTKIVNEEKRTSGTARAYVEVAAMMREAVKQESPKPLDLQQIEALLGKTDPGEPTNFYYFVGAFLQNRGDLQNAKKYLMLSATSPVPPESHARFGQRCTPRIEGADRTDAERGTR